MIERKKGMRQDKAASRWRTGSFLVALTVLSLALSGCQTGKFEHPPAQAADDPPQPEKVVLREGDTVKISFPSSPNLDTEQQIQRDGRISLMLVGEVDAAGMTLDELHDSLVKLYASQITSKEISVVLKSSSFPIFVTGYVLHPGKIVYTQRVTAFEAVMEAGVDYTSANLKSVRILRREDGESHNYVLNLKDILDGKDRQPFYLQPEDVIYVPQKFSVF